MANTHQNKADQGFDDMRDIGEKGVQQTRQAFERASAVAADASGAFQNAVATSSKTYKELGAKTVEMSRSNANAHFDFLGALLASKSINQAIELQTAYAREQMETFAEQTKELSTLAQKAMTESAKPMRDAAEKASRTVRSA